MSDATYNNQQIYTKQGASVQVFESGASQIANQNAAFQFYNDTGTADQIAALIKNLKSVTLTNLSTGSTVLSLLGGSSPPVLYSEYGTIFLSCTGTMTNGSARMASARAGQRLHIRFTPQAGGSTGSLIIYFSGATSGISGVRALASTGSDLSSIILHQSAASFAWVDLMGVADGVWSVITTGGDVTEQTE
jgi:hypothetical protein